MRKERKREKKKKRKKRKRKKREKRKRSKVQQPIMRHRHYCRERAFTVKAISVVQSIFEDRKQEGK